MNKYQRIAALPFLVAFAVSAQPVTAVPRWNGNPVSSTTGAAPGVSPWPAYSGPQCANPPCSGQSASVPGALHLDTCKSYSITVCGDGGSLLGGGTIQIYASPEIPQDAGSGQNAWARNPQLDETITASAVQCQRFAGHVADGIGWIDAVPNAVTLDSGTSVNIRIEAPCAN